VSIISHGADQHQILFDGLSLIDAILDVRIILLIYNEHVFNDFMRIGGNVLTGKFLNNLPIVRISRGFVQFYYILGFVKIA
jgi:hypothetical protein